MKTLKVCFVLDCTSSMTPWIQAAKNKLIETLESVCEVNKNYEIHVAFIGYRDYGELIHRVDFTKNHQYVYQEIKHIRAFGGDDQAEDVAGAYCWVNALEWDADVKLMFHITDAPEHGLKYHDDKVSDTYPQGNLVIDLLEEIHDLANTGVDLTVFKLNKSTNIMYSWMKQIYEEVNRSKFKIVDFMNSNQTPDYSFYNEVSSQLISSVSE